MVLSVSHLSKTFGHHRVVNDISFDIHQGEIFGFLGPNGSGKTTTMRMILDLIHPDSGAVMLFGSRPNLRSLHGVGYLPEERGLFKRVKVVDVLRYLGRLKGLDRKAAEARAVEMLERVGLAGSLRATIQSLSRGMTQLVQLAGALIHHPTLIILDEPFAGLDPLNLALMKSIIREEQSRGAAIIFSTHMMGEVEELCERVLLIDDGKTLLYKSLTELKRSHGRYVKVVADHLPACLSHLLEATNGSFHARLGPDSDPQTILQSFYAADISVESFEITPMSLNEIFIDEVVSARKHQ